jgi:hypothetical protein
MTHWGLYKSALMGGRAWLQANQRTTSDLEDGKISDDIERVEVAEHGAPNGVNEREATSVEVWAFAKRSIELSEFLTERLCLRGERGLVGGRVQAPDVVEHR